MEEGGSGMEGQIDNHGGKGEREGATEFSSSSCLISDVSLRP